MPGGLGETRPAVLSPEEGERFSGENADNAYSLREEAYATRKNAYAVDEEVHRSGFEDVHGAGEIELSSYKEGECPSLAKKPAAAARPMPRSAVTISDSAWGWAVCR